MQAWFWQEPVLLSDHGIMLHDIVYGSSNCYFIIFRECVLWAKMLSVDSYATSKESGYW
jgi:hypothetical protein